MRTGSDSKYMFVAELVADPSLSKAEILAKIDRDLNRGDGIYMTVNPKRVALFCQKRGRRK